MIRTLKKDDLNAIVGIDERVLGENRRNYWERKLELMNDRSSTVGWNDTIGIDPAYQKKGLATALSRELIQNLKALRVKTIYTLVSWNDWDLLQFFHAMGFTRGDMINLELKI